MELFLLVDVVNKVNALSEGEVEIGTVDTLAPGAEATASITGEFPLQFLNLGLPRGTQGVPGPQGTPGLIGPVGPIGPAGAPSSVPGPVGPAGATGAQGLQGLQGPIGLNGAPGATGPQGPIGPAGVQGNTGSTGPAGPVGPVGPAGADGQIGTGPAGGALSGTYPDPSLADSAVTTAKIADAGITLAKLSAIGTPDATKFLRGDNSWSPISLSGTAGGDLQGSYPNPTIKASVLNPYALTTAVTPLTAKSANVVAPVRALGLGQSLTIANNNVGVALDGVTLAAGDRVLLLQQTPSTDNGIYVVNAGGAMTRATDATTAATISQGSRVWVAQGTKWGGRDWVQFTDSPADFGQLSFNVPAFQQIVTPTGYPAGRGIGHAVFDSTREMQMVHNGAAWAPVATKVKPAWTPTTAYYVGQVVSYSGRMWQCKADNTGQPPALFTSSWTLLGGGDGGEWVERDPFFAADTISDGWELFWKGGTGSGARTTTAGEFETGLGGLKMTLPAANDLQRAHPKDETIIRDGEIVTITVRAKLAAAAAGATITAALLQNDSAGTPYPLATGCVTTAPVGGAQALTTSWQTYTFTFVAVNFKPRACFTVTGQAGSAPAVVLVDNIRTSRKVPVSTPVLVPTVQVFDTPGSTNWTKPANLVYAEVEVVGGGGAGGGAASPASGLGSAGAGGAGGGYVKKTFQAAALSASEQVTVGAGGDGVLGGNGGSGAPSTFSTGANLLTASPGGGGSTGGAAANWGAISGATGGTATGGDINVMGGPGETSARGTSGSYGQAGAGGDSSLGAGGRATYGGNGASGGVGYGGGGGGCCLSSTQAAAMGGGGRDGVVIVTSYVLTMV